MLEQPRQRPQPSLWSRFTAWLTARKVAAALIIIGVLFLFGGYTNKYCWQWCEWLPESPGLINNLLADFYANIVVTSWSITFAIFVIDQLNEQRKNEQL